MIPKKIHYIWLGNKPKTDLVLRCITSWKMFLPDYEIIEWNDDDLKSIGNNYVSEAVSAQKWAFASDYLRLYILYHHGGVYLDTDVQITNSITPFLCHDFFIGYEHYKKGFCPMTAVIGSKQYNYIIKELLDEYNDLHFITSDNTYDLTPNTVRFGHYFNKKLNIPFPAPTDNLTLLDKNSFIYPFHYFCNHIDNKKNYTIHHYNGSWIDGYARRDKFSFLNFRITRFKKISDKNNVMPLWHNEKILLKIKLTSKKTYALTTTIKD